MGQKTNKIIRMGQKKCFSFHGKVLKWHNMALLGLLWPFVVLNSSSTVFFCILALMHFFTVIVLSRLWRVCNKWFLQWNVSSTLHFNGLPMKRKQKNYPNTSCEFTFISYICIWNIYFDVTLQDSKIPNYLLVVAFKDLF